MMMKREQIKTAHITTITPKLLALAVAGAAAMPVMADSDFHAYFRSGIGSSTDGGDQVCYKAGGAPAKYRLGNECETYAALRLIHPIATEGKGSFKVTTEIIYNSDQNTDFESIKADGSGSGNDYIVPRRFNVSGTDVIEALPGATLWIGKEFVDRQDSHINDFFFWDPKGPGVGLKDVDVGFGKMSFAWVRNSSDDITDGEGDKGNLVNNTYDIRISKIAVTDKKYLEFGVDIGTTNATDDVAYEGKNNSGLLFTANFYQSDFMNGSNKLTIQKAKDGMIQEGSTGNQNGANSGSLFRIVDQGTTRLSGNLEAQYVAIYQKKDDDNAANGGYKWISAGIRPVYQWGGYSSTAVELGMDQIKPIKDGFDDTRMTKLTVAQQFSLGSSIMSRPALRLFATYAKWDENGNSNSGGVTPVDATSGLSFGAQTEVWF
jgi:maltoporin